MTKKQTFTQNITLMALMAGVNVIFTFMANLIWLSGLAIIIVLPLASALVGFLCQKRYFPIYLLASIGLSLIVSLQNIPTTVFYVIPSIIVGLVFGVLIQQKMYPAFIIIISAAIQSLLSFLSLLFVELVFEINPITRTLDLLGLPNNQTTITIVPAFIFVISLIQTCFAFLVLINEVRKLGIIVEDFYHVVIPFSGLTASLFLVGFAFLLPAVSYVLLVIIFFTSVVTLHETLVNKRKLSLILFAISAFVTLILISVIAEKLASIYIPLFSALPLLVLLLCNVLELYLNNKEKSIKIMGR